MQDNNQEKTVEDEVNEEIAKKNSETTNDHFGEGTEAKTEDDYVDLTKDEVQEEKKFQEVNNTAETLDTPEKIKQAKEEIISESSGEAVPDIEPKPKETTEEKPIIPTETANVIKDQDLIFLQYQCENEDCKFKFYINNLDADIGEKLKCFRCGKKLMKKKRIFDVTIKQFKDYVEEAK